MSSRSEQGGYLGDSTRPSIFAVVNGGGSPVPLHLVPKRLRVDFLLSPLRQQEPHQLLVPALSVPEKFPGHVD